MKLKDLSIFDAVLRESDIIFALMDLDGNYLDLYPVYDGYENIIGRPVFDQVKEDRVKLAKKHFDIALNGTTTSFEINSETEAGEIDWWQNTNIPIIKDGKVTYVLSLAKNINNERRFQKDDSLLQSLLSSSPDYIALVDENYRVMYVNKVQNAFKGTRFEGTKLADFLGEKHFEGLKEYLDKAKREKIVVSRRSSIKDNEGRTLFYESRFKYVENDGQGQYIIFSRDITFERENEITINRQQRKIDENSKWIALGEMSAGIAHEINNPLTIIKGRSRSLLKVLEEGDIERAKELVENISKSSDRIEHIVKGLKTYSRQEFDDPFQQICVNDVVKETIQLYRSQVTAENLELDTIFESEGIHVDGHPGEVSQVILNLLNNAKDAVLDDNGGWVKIIVRSSSEDAFIDVVNSGEILDPKIVAKIFDPFFTTKDVGKGTGLGLSLSRNIIRNHSGDLYFNRNTRNTTFTFSIPLS